ncbi:MAG: hypothetical protein Unbinned3620contig1001_40 [Prokaryotic dsDNA virus sp.]|nr:MAG: hypothetical protein Unbinned3620contig1001_40 [Prokaryotic dsDNA virus sp.]|tara:strand:+ start:5292 stop:5720 length:429 start_codon:yes stop_codon:yes gene_type:complete
MGKAYKQMNDPRVEAIRTDRLVGIGTCAYMDESLTDAELIHDLDACGIVDAREAVQWARQREVESMEFALNAMDCNPFGRTDAYRKQLEEFIEAMEEDEQCDVFGCDERSEGGGSTMCAWHAEEDGRGDHEMERMRDMEDDA